MRFDLDPVIGPYSLDRECSPAGGYGWVSVNTLTPSDLEAVIVEHLSVDSKKSVEIEDSEPLFGGVFLCREKNCQKHWESFMKNSRSFRPW